MHVNYWQAEQAYMYPTMQFGPRGWCVSSDRHQHSKEVCECQGLCIAHVNASEMNTCVWVTFPIISKRWTQVFISQAFPGLYMGNADLSTHTIPPCDTRFQAMSHDLTTRLRFHTTKRTIQPVDVNYGRRASKVAVRVHLCALRGCGHH